jgi:arylsulfatase A-like enzyme
MGRNLRTGRKGAATAVAAGCLVSCVGGQAEARPNILVIMTDDQGAGDLGWNNPLVNTPHLDQLAKESALFTNFVAAPACTPSRAAFLTGRNHYHTGVWGVGPRGYLNRDEVYLPEFLRRAGYATAHFGKWGEGWTPDGRTYMRGYETVGALGSGYQHQDPRIDFNGEIRQVKGWTSDILADLTIDFIEKQTAAGKPWYAITAYIAPHSPWICAPEFSDPLEAKGYSKPLAILYGMIEQMDAATGRILGVLDRLGLAENTIVVFLSDNGATPVCEQTGGTPMDGEDWAKRNPLGLRGRKSYIWENGIYVPLTVRWPGRIPPGERRQFGAIEDLLPTFLDLAGVPSAIAPEHLPFHGVSLKPILEHPETSDPERYVFRVAIADAGSPSLGSSGIIENPAALDYQRIHAGLRGPRFKFHHLPGGSHELYDLHSDPGETTDVSAQFPEKTGELAAACRAEWDRIVKSDRRSFTMPYFVIGDSRYAHLTRGWGQLPPDTVGGNAPLSVSGSVRAPFGGVTGFTKAGDSATFGLEVVTPGTYRIVLTGQNLDQCAPLSLQLGDRMIQPEKTSARLLDFGEADLPDGEMKISVRAGEPGGAVNAASFKEIEFRGIQ